MLHFKASKRPILAAVSLPGSAMAGLIAILGFASPASAELVSVTYWGTVHHGYDQTGVFGPAGADLAGDSYVAHYVFDTALGVITKEPGWKGAQGGNFFSPTNPAGPDFAASPLVSASVTINGHSVNIGGGYDDSISGGPSIGEAAYAVGLYSESWDSINPNPAFPSSITGPFTYDIPAFAGTAGFFVIATDDKKAQATIYSLTRLTIEPVEAVPEPSTWAMMLIGFMGLGYAGYRRAKGNSPAFADERA
jgi:PEP-CTERM motif